MSLSILCLDDDEAVLLSLRALLRSKSDYSVQIASDWQKASLILETDPVDIVLLDIHLGEGQKNGLELLPKIKRRHPSVDVIMVTGERDPGLFKKAMNKGADDYYQKPVDSDIILTVEKAEKRRQKDALNSALVAEISSIKDKNGFIGKSPAFLNVIKKASCLKGEQASILIESETGTGKELLAKYLHKSEDNPRRPFVILNCSAFPDNLFESEMFGHEKGAFTGANDKKIGKFELANGGDIFLDEINSLKPEFQAKLLRVIQDKCINRIGGSRPIQTEFRVISATNTNLKKLVDKGKFREDLYHRLNVVTLALPPLRKRPEDIPVLVEHFIKRYNIARSKNIKVSPSAMRFLKSYNWPGNVRELENQLLAMSITCKRNIIDIEDLPEHIVKQRIHPAILSTLKAIENNIDTNIDLFDLPLNSFIKAMQQQYLQKALDRNNGNVTLTAKRAGLTRQSIHRILKEELNL